MDARVGSSSVSVVAGQDDAGVVLAGRVPRFRTAGKGEIGQRSPESAKPESGGPEVQK
jgi:hypothetical protein